MSPDDPRHGTNKGYAAHLYTGTPPCAPCKRAHATAVRRWEYAKHCGRTLTIPARGVHRRIQALQRLGWTQTQIAEACGWKDGSHVKDVLKRNRCYFTTWQRVSAAYEQMCMTLPPPSDWRTRTQRKAERNGWPPPLWWDDIDRDETVPSENFTNGLHATIEPKDVDEAVVLRVLAGERLAANRAERVEILRIWRARGGTEADLCRRMGWREGRYGASSVYPSADHRGTERKVS